MDLFIRRDLQLFAIGTTAAAKNTRDRLLYRKSKYTKPTKY